MALILKDPGYFIRSYCMIKSDTGQGIIPFDLFDYQESLIDDFLGHKEVIILKARQLGITELVAAYVLWFVLRAYQTVVIISQGDEEAHDFLDKVILAWENLPDWLRPARVDERKKSELELANGSKVLPKPATSRAGRGQNAQLLVFDEWAHQQFQDKIFAAAAPATSAGNQIIGISTANGVNNLFHKQWQLAREGVGFHPVFLPWNSRPGRDEAWLAHVTATYEDWLKAQEFPLTEDEAFILSGRPRFDHEAIAALLRQTQAPITTTALGIDAQGRALGHYRVWEYPGSGHAYVIGADTAEGLQKGDFSAAVVLDLQTGLEVAELHGHWETEEYAAHLARVGADYNNALLAVERNNHGHSVLKSLQNDQHYPNLYTYQEYDQPDGQTKVGWQTSTKSKPIMIDRLAQTIKERRPWRNGMFLAEARNYVVTEKGDTSGSGSSLDDRVVAYAIAEQMRPRWDGQTAQATRPNKPTDRSGYRQYG